MSVRKSSRLAKKVMPEEEPEIEEEDEAPEEIGLSAGRESAIKRIEAEKEGDRRAKATKRELAAKRQQSKEQNKLASKQENEDKEAVDAEEAHQPPLDAMHNDLLPTSVLLAIEERKRAHNRAQEQHLIIREALKPKQKKAKAGKGRIGKVGLAGVQKASEA
jgi:hypothetical protein